MQRFLDTRVVALAAALALTLAVAPAEAQNITGLPRVSPHATVTQTIGMTEVTIDYHRPAVQNRQVWGGLVPYDAVWRAGANDNTVITFSTPVTVEDQALAAGSYGLHMVPGENEWAVVFSHNDTSWGSFSYDPSEDALRVKVRPEKAPFAEWLSYGFEDLGADSAVAVLHWEELKVPFEIGTDTHALTLAHIRNELRHLPGFAWQGWSSAAGYCVQADCDAEEAMGWIDRSIGMDRNSQNLLVKSRLLAKAGQDEEAKAVVAEALDGANEAQTNAIGYTFLFGGDAERAIEVFQRNTRDHPESWNVWDSLGEAYAAKGETAKAIENYSKAMAMTEDEAQKARIHGVLEGLRAD